MKSSAFRGWVHNLWIENCEERMLYNGGERLSERDYFRFYRWWLRQEWRRRQQQDQELLARALEAEKKIAQSLRPDQ
jgi:hypothetical protein